MTQKEKQWKVFLCYAREDQAITDDFFYRFKKYNERDMEILNDRTPNSQNMHELFHQFANECDVAILLVNASFVNPASYSNQYEVPVLIERQKEGKVVLVGVRFSNVYDLEEWNKEGDVCFFSLTNNDLTFTRSKKPDDRVFLTSFAVYQQVDSKDLDFFHDRLRQWIKECLQKDHSMSQVISKEVFRDASILENLLLIMKPNSLLYKLENKLSTDKSLWDISGIAMPGESEVWTFWYCLRQSEKLEECQVKLLQLSPEDPIRRIDNQFDNIKKRVLSIRRLLDFEFTDEDSLDLKLDKTLGKIEKVISKSMEKVVMSPRKNHIEAKSDLSDAIEELRDVLKSLAGISLGTS